jgi:hypothetical protein
LKPEKLKREPIPIPIIETGGTPQSKPRLKTKPKRKRVVGSTPKFHTETETVDTESETDAGSDSPGNSKYIQDVLKCRKSHDPTFGIYQDNTDGSLRIGSSRFKYKNIHVSVDGKKYKATEELWQLLT